MLIRLEAYGPGDQTYTIIDDAVVPGTYGVIPLAGIDWGDAEVVSEYSGPRGTLGRVVSSQTWNDRVVTIPVRVAGSSKDDLAARVSGLLEVMEAIRQYGGRIVRRATGQTPRQYLQVSTCSSRVTGWSQRRSEVGHRMELALQFQCAPYAEGDPLDWDDTFTSDWFTAGSYTADAGVVGDVSAGAGALTLVGATGSERRFVYTASGYQLQDRLVYVKFTASGTVAGEKVGVVFRRRDANNYLAVIWTLGANTFELRKVVGGTVTTQAITVTGGPTPAAGKTYILSTRTWGDYLGVGVKEDDTNVAIVGDDDPASTTGAGWVTLTSTDAVNHSRARGTAGFLWLPQAATGAIRLFADRPFTFRQPTSDSSTSINPMSVNWADAIPGDVPARCAIDITTGTGSSVDQILCAWSQTRTPHNKIGDGRYFTSGNATSGGWRVTGTGSGVVGAATSLTVQTAPTNAWAIHRGGISAVITTTAVVNSGAAYQIPMNLHGERWVAIAWLAGNLTTNAQIIVGTSGNNATSTAAALPTSGAPVMHKAVLSGACTRPEFGVRVTAATATQIYLSNPLVFQGRWTNLASTVTSAATSMTVTSYPQDWPEFAPFDVLIDSEYVTVTAVSGTTLTVKRGVEGTTAASHTANADMYLLPTYEQRVGPVGHPVGSIVAPSEYSANVATDTTYSSSERLVTMSTGTSVMVPVNSANASDANAATCSVEVWLALFPNSTNPQIRVSAVDPSTTYTVASPEYGQSWIPLHGNTAYGGDPYWIRAGTLALPAGTRSLIKIEYQHTSGTGLDLYWCGVLPAGGVASTPLGFALQGSTVRVSPTLAVSQDGVVPRGSATGALVEIPDGQVVTSHRLFEIASPVSDGRGVHLAVTPRWQVLRV